MTHAEQSSVQAGFGSKIRHVCPVAASEVESTVLEHTVNIVSQTRAALAPTRFDGEFISAMVGYNEHKFKPN